MVRRYEHAHPEGLYSNQDATNEFDKAKGQHTGGKFKSCAEGCPSAAYDPAWCHEAGDMRATAPNGLDYPARAFGAAGPWTTADFEAGFKGFFLEDYQDGAFDGRQFGTCEQLPTCAPCSTFAPCGSVEIDLDTAAAVAQGASLTYAVGPELAGTSLENNIGDNTAAVAAANAFEIGVVEEDTRVFQLQFDANGLPLSTALGNPDYQLQTDSKPCVLMFGGKPMK